MCLIARRDSNSRATCDERARSLTRLLCLHCLGKEGRGDLVDALVIENLCTKEYIVVADKVMGASALDVVSSPRYSPDILDLA